MNHPQESKDARLNDVYVKLLKRLELGHKAALGVGRDNLRLLGEAYDDAQLPDLMVRCEKRAALLAKATLPHGGTDRGRGRSAYPN